MTEFFSQDHQERRSERDDEKLTISNRETIRETTRRELGLSGSNAEQTDSPSDEFPSPWGQRKSSLGHSGRELPDQNPISSVPPPLKPRQIDPLESVEATASKSEIPEAFWANQKHPLRDRREAEANASEGREEKSDQSREVASSDEEIASSRGFEDRVPDDPARETLDVPGDRVLTGMDDEGLDGTIEQPINTNHPEGFSEVPAESPASDEVEAETSENAMREHVLAMVSSLWQEGDRDSVPWWYLPDAVVSKGHWNLVGHEAIADDLAAEHRVISPSRVIVHSVGSLRVGDGVSTRSDTIAAARWTRCGKGPQGVDTEVDVLSWWWLRDRRVFQERHHTDQLAIADRLGQSRTEAIALLQGGSRGAMVCGLDRERDTPEVSFDGFAPILAYLRASYDSSGPDLDGLTSCDVRILSWETGQEILRGEQNLAQAIRTLKSRVESLSVVIDAACPAQCVHPDPDRGSPNTLWLVALTLTGLDTRGLMGEPTDRPFLLRASLELSVDSEGQVCCDRGVFDVADLLAQLSFQDDQRDDPLGQRDARASFDEEEGRVLGVPILLRRSQPA